MNRYLIALLNGRVRPVVTRTAALHTEDTGIGLGVSNRVSAVLAALSLSTVAATAAEPALAAVVQADQPGHAIPKTLYGIFFEDINYAADGGLYAELIANRGFRLADPGPAGLGKGISRWRHGPTSAGRRGSPSIPTPRNTCASKSSTRARTRPVWVWPTRASAASP